MKIEVFDDPPSLVHLIVGALGNFFPAIFVIFVFYQIVEHMVKNSEKPGKEKVQNMLGDFAEYCFGSTVAALLAALV